MEDEKEAAEHATIVDLIRNDLSQVATDVRMDRLSKEKSSRQVAESPQKVIATRNMRK